MDFYNRQILKKTSSGIGFYMFTATIMLYFSTYLLYFIGVFKQADYTSSAFSMIISTVASITSMFLIGLIYCKASRTSVQSVVPVKSVKPSYLFGVVAIALAVSLLSNYITDIFLSSISLFGYENNIDMSFETKTPFENFLYIFSVAVIPAFTEEFMFRGIILHKLRAYGDSFAVLVSSLFFGLIHGNLVQIPFAFIVGLALSFAVIKTGSLLPSIIVHFTVNCSSVLVSILEPNIEASALNSYYAIFIIMVIMLAIASAVKLGSQRDFFKLSSNPSFPLKEAVRTTLSTKGVIFAFIVIILEITTSLWI